LAILNIPTGYIESDM
jgi:hypothetical protein